MPKKKTLKEKSMTNQQPYASTWSLSRMCQALMGLGICKIALFVALGLGYSFPNIDFMDLLSKDVSLMSGAENTVQTNQANSAHQAGGPTASMVAQGQQATAANPAGSMGNPYSQGVVPSAHAQGLQNQHLMHQGQVLIAASAAQNGGAVNPSVSSASVAQERPEPQGSAAVRAAQAYTTQKKNILAAGYPNVNVLSMPAGRAPDLTPHAQNPQGSLGAQGAQRTQIQGGNVTSSAVNTLSTEKNAQTSGNNKGQVATDAKPMTLKATAPKPEDVSWWTTLDISSLPIPRLGVDEVAYAATLDTNLNPPPPPAVSPQGVTPFSPPEQKIQPAGTAGPYGNTIPAYNPFVPNANPPAPDVNSYTPREDPLRKEQELARREQEILLLKQQMEERLKELQAAERKVQGMLNEAKDVESNKMNELTNMYTNMKPRQAGAAMEQLDEHIAAKILLSMRAKQAGEILSYMNPIKTAKLTEILTRMRLAP